MKKYDAEHIRNIGIIGHGSVGKTSLTEAILFNANAIDRLGKVDDGTTTTDYGDDEKKRNISISAAVAHCEWSKHKINIIDMPGFADFVSETKARGHGTPYRWQGTRKWNDVVSSEEW